MTTAEGTETTALEFVFEVRAAIAPAAVVGKSKRGERKIVPITGGAFVGERMHGEVVPGGFDLQLVRPDGDIELDAMYMLRAGDGALIYVRNRALVHIPPGAKSIADVYVRTAPEFEAPSDGPYAWLNHSLFVGHLVQAAPDLVVIRVHRVR